MTSIPMKVDVYRCEDRFKRWQTDVRADGEPGLTKENSSLLMLYLQDMEMGRNVSRHSKRGPRSYIRLNALRYRLKHLFQLLEKRGVTDIRQVTEEQVVALFHDFETGKIRTRRGEAYRSTSDSAKAFKAFWNWWIKVNRKRGQRVENIAEDVSTIGQGQAKFVYLTKENVEALMEYSDPDMQVLLMFLFDSIIRAPTELLSLQVRHIYERDGEVWASVPGEVSKTFGRTFNLLYCGEMVADYIRRKGLKPEDRLFQVSAPVVNRQLKMLAAQVLGQGLSHPQGDYYRNLSLYDFRHSGAIHLRLLAKDNPGQISLDAIRHRGGWTDFKMLNYYTQFIGLDGRIERQGMLLRQDKHKLEEEVETLRNELRAIRELNTKILQVAQLGLSTSNGTAV